MRALVLVACCPATFAWTLGRECVVRRLDTFRSQSAHRVQACGTGLATMSILKGLKLDEKPVLREGDQVRVTRSLTMKHIPGGRGGFDVKGLVGEVKRVYTEEHLSP